MNLEGEGKVSKKQPRLLIINYSMDAKDPIFSHQEQIAFKLSDKFENVTVLTHHSSSNTGPLENSKLKIYLLKWGEKRNWVKIFSFYYCLIKILSRRKINLVFFHMTDLDAALGIFVLKILRIPSLLWYAHSNASVYLKIYEKFGTNIISSTKGSCQIDSNKVKFIGQSIDYKQFYLRKNAILGKDKFVHVGRIDASKNLELIIKSLLEFRKKNPKIQLHLYGVPTNQDYFKKFMSYVEAINEQSFEAWIFYHKSILRSQLRNEFLKYDVFIHAFLGSLDKALLEAALAGLPVISINPEFALQFPEMSITNKNLQDQILDFYQSNNEVILKKIEYTQKLIHLNHSLDNWIDNVESELRNLVKN